MDNATVGRQARDHWDDRHDLGRNRAARAQKNDLKPWVKQQWCIASVGADFVWRMEDVLDLYAEPYDPQRPVVCFDELP